MNALPVEDGLLPWLGALKLPHISVAARSEKERGAEDCEREEVSVTGESLRIAAVGLPMGATPVEAPETPPRLDWPTTVGPPPYKE